MTTPATSLIGQTQEKVKHGRRRHADRIDQPGDAPETVQPPTGEVGYVGDPAEGDEMMRADAVDGDAAHHHHVAACVVEAFAERGGRVEIVAAEQATLPEFADALGGAPHVPGVGGDAAGAQQIVDGALERRRVEVVLAGDPDAGRGRTGGGIVIAGIGHGISPGEGRIIHATPRRLER